MKKIAVAALALAGGLAALAPAAGVAQPRQAPPAAEDGRAPAPRMRERLTPEQRIERRAERLRATLQLQPAQDGALRAYVAAITPSAEQRAQRRQMRHDLAQMTTPQRLDARKARMAERMAMFERRADATKRFYGQLTPAQQKAFDAMASERGGRGKHGPHRGRGHGGHRGPAAAG
ncbi:Spy/CpxP family protein refolding chaperone [Phenylobacterium terrae]|uniref:Spy/CpxP family protein refolding chaperone n=1 Tax=Phenylobacterium terrae TaxID=2665495 RepID=A0ABW4N2D1_9CAUL